MEKETVKYYECHITFTNTTEISPDKYRTETGWIFSKIDGDPNLGTGVKSYLTKQYSARTLYTDLLREIAKAEKILLTLGAQILRDKIEAVVYDSRQH